MNHLSLFSGIGGIDLAGHWAGMKTVAFCEREPFPQKVLQKNFPGVPIYDDVCTLTIARLEEDGIIGDRRTIDIISGGYPCQPFSVAGKREGKNDDRHLWPEVKRLLEEIRPRWFVGENVAGHITLGLDTVLSDLADIGYTSQSFVIPACSVGARHRRDRVFIVANSNGSRWEGHEFSSKSGKKRLDCWRSNEKVLPNSDCITRLEANTKVSTIGNERITRNDVSGIHWREASRFDREIPEPAVLGMANGFSRRLDENRSRLKALGNAVVPAQIYPIMAAIKAIDDALEV